MTYWLLLLACVLILLAVIGYAVYTDWMVGKILAAHHEAFFKSGKPGV